MAKLSAWSLWFSKTLTGLFICLFFLTPLVLWPKTSELFEFNKMLLVYALTVLVAAASLAKGIINKKFTLVRTPLDLGLLLFLASQILATIFSIDPHTSVWGYYSRFHGGLASTISYISLFYFFVAQLNSVPADQRKRQLNSYFYALLASGTLVAIYGVLEHLGIDKNLWIQDVQNRVFSTLGQPNWLSAYLLALLPLTIYLGLQSKRTARRWLWLLISLLYVVTILFTKSRSGIGATLVILALIGLEQLYRLVAKRKLNRASLVLLTGVVLSLAIFGSPWSPNPADVVRRLETGGPLWPEIEPYLNQLRLTSQLKPLDTTNLDPQSRQTLEKRAQGERVGGSSSLEIRQTVWQGAIELFRRRPLLGTGVETFGYSYYWTRPTGHNLLSEWDFLYNKAHNEFLNILSTTGMLGFAAYIFLIIADLRLFLRQMKRQNPLAFPLLVGFISILITNFFGFSVVIIGVFFFMFPGLAMFYGKETVYPQKNFGNGWNLSNKQIKSGQLKTSAMQYLLLGLILAGLIFSLRQVWLFWRADINYSESKLYQQAGYLGQALTLAQKATALLPSEANFHAQLGEIYADIAWAMHQKLSTGPTEGSALVQNQTIIQRDIYASNAADEINIAVRQNPWHLNLWKSKAKIELTIAIFNNDYFQTALATLAHANELAPTDAKIVYNIGLVYEQLGKMDQAKQAYQKALDLKPDYEAVRYDLTKLEASSAAEQP